MTSSDQLVDLSSRYGPWALVAGASSGLGAAFAEAVARRGCHVVLAARRREVLEDTAQDIGVRHGVQTRTIVVDLAEETAAARLLDGTADLDLGVSVYNAAAEPQGPFDDASVRELRSNLAVNCWTPTLLCQGLGPRLRARGRGAVAIVSSMAALQGIPQFAVYGAAKAYELILAESLWDEWRGDGVDALSYVVGATASPNFGGAEPDGYTADLPPGADRILRPSTPTEVAERLGDRFHLGPRQYSHDADEAKAFADAALDRREVVTAMGRLTAGLARTHYA